MTDIYKSYILLQMLPKEILILITEYIQVPQFYYTFRASCSTIYNCIPFRMKMPWDKFQKYHSKECRIDSSLKYWYAYRRCWGRIDIILSTLPNDLSEVFDYFAAVEDFLYDRGYLLQGLVGNIVNNIVLSLEPERIASCSFGSFEYVASNAASTGNLNAMKRIPINLLSSLGCINEACLHSRFAVLEYLLENGVATKTVLLSKIISFRNSEYKFEFEEMAEDEQDFQRCIVLLLKSGLQFTKKIILKIWKKEYLIEVNRFRKALIPDFCEDILDNELYQISQIVKDEVMEYLENI